MPIFTTVSDVQELLMLVLAVHDAGADSAGGEGQV
jgi:hypothetical protein